MKDPQNFFLVMMSHHLIRGEKVSSVHDTEQQAIDRMAYAIEHMPKQYSFRISTCDREDVIVDVASGAVFPARGAWSKQRSTNDPEATNEAAHRRGASQ